MGKYLKKKSITDMHHVLLWCAAFEKEVERQEALSVAWLTITITYKHRCLNTGL